MTVNAFSGYRVPDYTQVPNLILDEQMAELSCSELKVLLYIVRRTLGFQRASDSVSLTQITAGIAGRDRGTGLSRRSAVAAVRALERQGYIRVTRGHASTGNWDASTYSLVMQIGIGQKSNHPREVSTLPRAKSTPPGREKTSPGVGQKSNPQKKDEKDSTKKGRNDDDVRARTGKVSRRDLTREQRAELDAVMEVLFPFKGRLADEAIVIQLLLDMPTIDLVEEARAFAEHYDREGIPVKSLRKFNDWCRKARYPLRQKGDPSAARSEIANEPPPEMAPPPSGVRIWDDIRHWARYLASQAKLPQRTPEETLFEEFSPVSHIGGVLRMRGPDDFHPYDRLQWTSTLQRLAQHWVGEPLAGIEWEDEVESSATRGAA